MERKDNSGALFKNDRKREGKKDADYRGTALIAGVEYYVDAWVNESKDGRKYLGVKYKPKGDAPTVVPMVAQQSPPPVDEFDDAIPF